MRQEITIKSYRTSLFYILIIKSKLCQIMLATLGKKAKAYCHCQIPEDGIRSSVRMKNNLFIGHFVLLL